MKAVSAIQQRTQNRCTSLGGHESQQPAQQHKPLKKQIKVAVDTVCRQLKIDLTQHSGQLPALASSALISQTRSARGPVHHPRQLSQSDLKPWHKAPGPSKISIIPEKAPILHSEKEDPNVLFSTSFDSMCQIDEDAQIQTVNQSMVPKVAP